MEKVNRNKFKRCPDCKTSHSFVVTAHVTQDWIVDKYGNFISCADECVDVVHKPDDEDIWECTICGYSAAGKNFNVEE